MSHRCIFFVGVLALVLASIVPAQVYYPKDLNPGPGISSRLYRGQGGVFAGDLSNMSTMQGAAAIRTSTSWVTLSAYGPSGFQLALDVDGIYQVGFIGNAWTNGASVWQGSPASFINLHPPGDYSSGALGIKAKQIVGYVTPYQYGNDVAVMWTIPSFTLIQMHPVATLGSILFATTGSYQVGGVLVLTGWHAGFWDGSATAFVDIHPSWAEQSAAYDADRNTIVGWIQMANGNRHAARWTGPDPNSAVDLHPTMAVQSTAYGVSRNVIVGEYHAPSSFFPFAAVFDGPGGFVDLHSFLGPNYTWSSARGIDEFGNIIGYAGTIWNEVHAIVWRP